MADDKKQEQKAATVEVKQDSIALGIAMGVQAALQQLGLVQPKHEAVVQGGETAKRMARGECNVCRQPLSGCEGKHVEMVVYPTRYPEHADFFPGVYINGTRYLSNDENHKVVVPAISQSDILSAVRQFEDGERAIGQSRNRRHNSGRISPNGSSINQYQGRGFR